MGNDKRPRTKTPCRKCGLLPSSRKGGLCYRCWVPPDDEEELPSQLRAVRRAARHRDYNPIPKDPEVRSYLELKEKNLAGFLALRERLEKVYTQTRARINREKSRTPANTPAPREGQPPAIADDYDRSKDRVTPALENMIEAWLDEKYAAAKEKVRLATGG